MRTKGAKNKSTIEMERLIAEGMNPLLAKIRARENLGMKALATKATPTKVKTEKTKRKAPVRKVKDKTEKVTKAKKKDTQYPGFVAGFNTTTKSVWLRAKNGNSRKSAIRAHCLMCVGGSVKEVKDCSAEETCPLWKFRITG